MVMRCIKFHKNFNILCFYIFWIWSKKAFVTQTQDCLLWFHMYCTNNRNHFIGADSRLKNPSDKVQWQLIQISGSLYRLSVQVVSMRADRCLIMLNWRTTYVYIILLSSSNRKYESSTMKQWYVLCVLLCSWKYIETRTYHVPLLPTIWWNNIGSVAGSQILCHR